MSRWQLTPQHDQPCIFNLLQSPDSRCSMGTKLPTLMANTSLLWSTMHERVLLPVEHLMAMGVPLYQRGRSLSERFAIEHLILQGELGRHQCKVLAGNTMSSVACAAVLMFALGSIEA